MIAYTSKKDQVIKSGSLLWWEIDYCNGKCMIFIADEKHLANAYAMEDLYGPEVFVEMENECSQVFNNVESNLPDHVSIFSTVEDRAEYSIVRFIDRGQYEDLPTASLCTETYKQYKAYWKQRRNKFLTEYKDLCERYNLMLVGVDDGVPRCTAIRTSFTYSEQKNRWLSLKAQMKKLKNERNPRP